MSLPGGSVEASRAQRVERQQARYRDRGGIFKPADHNPLLDLLLARGVNGESPSRASSPRRSPSRSTSPRRKQPSHSQHTHTTRPPGAVKPQTKRRRGSKSALTDPDGTVVHPQIDLDDLSAPGPSVPAGPAPSRKSRASKSTNKPSRTKSSVHSVPSPDPSDDESPPKARASSSRARDNAPKSAKEKPSKPKQSRNRKAPLQNSVPTSHIETSTDHAALGTTSRKRVQKKVATSKSKVAVVAKLPTGDDDEGDGDANAAPARSRHKPSARSVKSLHSDSEQLCVPKKSTKGKAKAKSLEEADPSSQGGKITAKTTTKRETGSGANTQSDLDKGATLETDTQTSTSLETKKRKKLPAPPTSNNNTLRVHLESDSEKPSPTSRTSSPEPPAKEPAKKRHKARQAADDDGDKVLEERESQIQNRQPSRQTGSAKDHLKATRKVSRSKALPIPMPNGVRLKPKPRPRLSMFQPPPDDDTSDRDPIDFLS